MMNFVNNCEFLNKDEVREWRGLREGIVMSGIYLEGFGFYLVLMVMVNIFSDILLVVCKWMIWVFC